MSSRCLRESISVIPISTRICEIQCSRDHRLRKSLASKELRKGAEDKLSLTFALLQLSPRCLPQSVSANPISTRNYGIQCPRDHYFRKSLILKELRKGAEDKLRRLDRKCRYAERHRSSSPRDSSDRIVVLAFRSIAMVSAAGRGASCFGGRRKAWIR